MTAFWVAAVLGGAAIVFAISVGIGILLGRRLDRVLESRAAAQDAEVRSTDAPMEVRADE